MNSTTFFRPISLAILLFYATGCRTVELVSHHSTDQLISADSLPESLLDSILMMQSDDGMLSAGVADDGSSLLLHCETNDRAVGMALMHSGLTVRLGTASKSLNRVGIRYPVGGPQRGRMRLQMQDRAGPESVPPPEPVDLLMEEMVLYDAGSNDGRYVRAFTAQKLGISVRMKPTQRGGVSFDLLMPLVEDSLHRIGILTQRDSMFLVTITAGDAAESGHHEVSGFGSPPGGGRGGPGGGAPPPPPGGMNGGGPPGGGHGAPAAVSLDASFRILLSR